MIAGLDKKDDVSSDPPLLPPPRSGVLNISSPSKVIQANDKTSTKQVAYRLNEFGFGSILNFRDALGLMRGKADPVRVYLDVRGQKREFIMRPNVVYRCSTLDQIDGMDANRVLRGLNLRTIVDLRGGSEGEPSLTLHSHFDNLGGKKGRDGRLAWQRRREMLGLFSQQDWKENSGPKWLEKPVKVLNFFLGLLPVVLSGILVNFFRLLGLPVQVREKKDLSVDFDLPQPTWNGPEAPGAVPRSQDMPNQDSHVDEGRFIYRFDFLSKPIGAQFSLQPMWFKLQFLSKFIFKSTRPEAMVMFCKRVLGSHKPGLAWLNRQVLQNSGDLVRDALEVILEGVEESLAWKGQGPGGSVVFHCSAGKDRTGLVNALLLSILGVDTDIILADYLRSEKELDGVFWFLEREVIKQGLSADWAHVEDAIMRDTLTQLWTTYKSPAHFLEAIGFDYRKQQRLRDLLLVPVDSEQGAQVLNMIKQREEDRDNKVGEIGEGKGVMGRRGSLVPLNDVEVGGDLLDD